MLSGHLVTVVVMGLQGMDPPVQLDEQQTAAWLKDKQFLYQLIDIAKVHAVALGTLSFVGHFSMQSTSSVHKQCTTLH